MKQKYIIYFTFSFIYPFYLLYQFLIQTLNYQVLNLYPLRFLFAYLNDIQEHFCV